jgi:hypothetical protein
MKLQQVVESHFCVMTQFLTPSAVITTLEIRLGTRQLPRQVTIFHSLPRQKNAEAIPPVIP